MASANASAARALVSRYHKGALCTFFSRKPGFPFGSVVLYALDEQGRPFFVLSSLAVHTNNIEANPNATLLVAEDATDEGVLSAARVNLMGSVTAVEGSVDAHLRAVFLKVHPSAKEWIDFGDFQVYRMEVSEIYWVGGFGQMGWVSVDDYTAASG